ncbi:MAG: S-methyl-5-thioribose-1-phosphate isomerase [Caldilineaceae bacterium]|nr:S-methyl-5-thioribose-1-phosphate isomerase [Caldilineaceae bacterium]
MNVHGQHYRTIWLKADNPTVVQIIDQRQLPFHFVVEELTTVEAVAAAIQEMHVRGAGLIGATAGYGMMLAALHAPRASLRVFRAAVEADAAQLKATRPTAVNLAWAVDRQLAAMRAAGNDIAAQIEAAIATAQTIADEDADFCRRIGEHGVALIEEIAKRKAGAPVNVLTHCNAGWLAFVDYGTATAPIYAAHDRGVNVHVWVDETRPRNQGARLTAWELGQHGVPHTVIVDNAGGHLMQHGLVDLVIVGSDRTTYTGDVANKIGTYLKALAAHDNNVPFYVALPSSTLDWEMRDGLAEIPIEERDAAEVRRMDGRSDDGIREILIMPESSRAANYAFDVTPARLVTGLITERGVCAASEAGVLGLYPEKRRAYAGASS